MYKRQVLVGVNTSGTAGPPSAETAATPLKVDGPDLVANSVSTAHLRAGAVTADKLQALLVLATTVLAGVPGGARVELDQGGLRGYNTAGTLVFAVDAAGNSVFTGHVTASDITGSTAASTGFSNDGETGIHGWRLSADGTVEIRDLTVGNDLYSINPTGQAAFQSVTADALTLGGRDLAAVLDARPRGVLQVTELTGDSDHTTGTDTNTLFLRAIIPAVSARQYEVTLHNAHVNPGATTPTYCGIRVFAKYGSAASPADTKVANLQSRSPAAGSDLVAPLTFSFTSPPASLGQDLHLAFYVYASTGDANNGTNVQSEPIGATRLVIQDIGAPVTPSVWDISLPGGGSGGTTAYTTTYDPVWSATWSATGKRTDNAAYQGRYSATQGTQYAKWGFGAQIQTDLSGATVDTVELYLKNTHWYQSGGGDAMIGTHANATKPTGSSSTDGAFDRTRVRFGYGQGKWVTLPAVFGADLKSGAARGITLGAPGTGTQALYGYFRRYDTSHPQLRITYRK